MQEKKPTVVVVDKDLVWGNTNQNSENHRAEGVASGSVLPVGNEIPPSTTNGQQH